MRFRPHVSFAVIVVGMAALNVTPGDAQTPPPTKEAELVAAGHKRMTGQQSSTLLVGNTSYILYLAPLGGAKAGTLLPMFWRDAKTRIAVAPGGKKIETNWWIEGDFVCGEQQVINRGHSCSSNYQVNSSYYSCVQPAGDCVYLMRVVPGNPDGI